jgi:hypothetical protein
MNEREFGDWLQHSLDRHQVPPGLTPKVRAGARSRSVATRFIGTAVPTIVLVLIAAVIFGVRTLHSNTGVVGPSPHPSPLVSPTPTALANSRCQLPLSTITAQGHPPLQQPGFLTYPDGSYQADGSVGAGPSIWSFDASLHRWVPALLRYLSPDGRYYVADSANASISIVDVVTGAQTQLVSSGAVQVLGWANQGIVYRGQSGRRQSLLLIDPQTRASRELSVPVLLPQGRVYGDALWVIGVDASNAPILVRFDLTNGERSIRYRFAQHAQSHGSLPTIQGFDDVGNPVIVDAPSGLGSPFEVLLVTGIQKATTIYSGQASSSFRPAQQAIGDPRGIWMLGTNGSLWLYDAAHGLHSIPLPPGTPAIAALSGACK